MGRTVPSYRLAAEREKSTDLQRKEKKVQTCSGKRKKKGTSIIPLTL
jgi:hypothetical protein